MRAAELAVGGGSACKRPSGRRTALLMQARSADRCSRGPHGAPVGMFHVEHASSSDMRQIHLAVVRHGDPHPAELQRRATPRWSTRLCAARGGTVPGRSVKRDVLEPERRAASLAAHSPQVRSVARRSPGSAVLGRPTRDDGGSEWSRTVATAPPAMPRGISQRTHPRRASRVCLSYSTCQAVSAEADGCFTWNDARG